jgi:hypothetical protein
VRLLELLEHGVEALPEPAELVRSTDVHSGREVPGLGDLLGAVGEPLDRLKRSRGDEPPQQHCHAQATDRGQGKDARQVEQLPARLAEWFGHLQRLSVAERDSEDPIGLVADLEVGGEPVLLAGCDRSGLGVDGGVQPVPTGSEVPSARTRRA